MLQEPDFTPQNIAEQEIKPETNPYIAVIDIGSNSVRLVVYSGLTRVADSVFNEKIMCGLGAEVGSTGKMGNSAVKHAIATLKRFKVLCTQMQVSQVLAVATAAVRDAKNGPAFVKRVKKECGFDISVIEGEEEGRLAGLGVISGDPRATGIMGDLGGGSLELVRLKGGKVYETISLKMGPLRLISRFGKDKTAMKQYIQRKLSKLDWVKDCKGQDFYLVGGAWRNIAKLMMREKANPLPILHGFKCNRSEMTSYCTRLSKLLPEDLPFSRSIPSRRREVLPVAALILKEVLNFMGGRRSVISSYGLREGLLFNLLSDDDQKIDPFIERCRIMAEERCRFAEHADTIYDWTRPLFTKNSLQTREAQKKLHMAVCLLSDIAWRGHPDFRAEKAVEAVLHGHFVGITHRGRAFLAVAMNEAYGAPIDSAKVAPILPLLTVTQVLEARTLGASLRLAQRLSGGVISALEQSRLVKTRYKIYLEINEKNSDLSNDLVDKRLRQLAQLVGRQSKIKMKKPEKVITLV